jgi:5-methylcytosine-specific restriction protein A
MTRSVPEWRGKTDDTAIPDRVKLRVHAKAEGRCAKCCTETLSGQYDHAISLVLGGENRESNLQFLCVPCHKAKTKLDVKLKAKVARVRKRHLGIKKPRTIRAWRRFDGTPVYAGRDR